MEMQWDCDVLPNKLLCHAREHALILTYLQASVSYQKAVMFLSSPYYRYACCKLHVLLRACIHLNMVM